MDSRLKVDCISFILHQYSKIQQSKISTQSKWIMQTFLFAATAGSSSCLGTALFPWSEAIILTSNCFHRAWHAAADKLVWEKGTWKLFFSQDDDISGTSNTAAILVIVAKCMCVCVCVGGSGWTHTHTRTRTHIHQHTPTYTLPINALPLNTIPLNAHSTHTQRTLNAHSTHTQHTLNTHSTHTQHTHTHTHCPLSLAWLTCSNSYLGMELIWICLMLQLLYMCLCVSVATFQMWLIYNIYHSPGGIARDCLFHIHFHKYLDKCNLICHVWWMNVCMYVCMYV